MRPAVQDRLHLRGIPGHYDAETLYGRVVGVADGDTLTLLDRDNRQRKIRIAGIDAPEKGQPFGEVFDRNVRAECYKEDRYRWQVCRLFDGSRHVALAQLDAGLAWWFRRYAAEQPPQERAEYASAEDRARADAVGLRRDRDPVPPWEWRNVRKGD